MQEHAAACQWDTSSDTSAWHAEDDLGLVAAGLELAERVQLIPQGAMSSQKLARHRRPAQGTLSKC